jgi:hypothetical protein
MTVFAMIEAVLPDEALAGMCALHQQSPFRNE